MKGKLGIVFVAVVSLALLGCEETPVSNGATSNGTASNGTLSNGTMPGDNNGMPEETSENLSAQCEQICDARNNVDQGFCDYFSAENCTVYCQEQATAWDDGVWDAFMQCAETDPLCFQDINQCMMAGLYPDNGAIDHMVTLRGRGFGFFGGRTVYAKFQYGHAAEFTEQTNVQDGEFAFQRSFSEEPSFSASGVSIVLFVDVDGDGVCSHDSIDLVYALRGQPLFGTTPLEHVAEVGTDGALMGAEAQTSCSVF